MNIELDFSTYLDKYENYEDVYLDLVKSTFNHLKLKFDPVISVSFITNEDIREINRQYRNVDSPTDVISFAYLDNVSNKETFIKTNKIVVLGEIYISIPRAIEQADQFGHSLHRELCFLFVHGLLHLLGYDHMNKEDEEVMFSLQNAILDKEGIVRWIKLN